MPFDYKKEYKEFYLPKNKPTTITIPKMRYLAVRGKGDPNSPEGEYKKSISLLYTIAFTIKMSKKGDHKIDGYFDYVVPPLEGFWWQDGHNDSIDYSQKDKFNFISVIRLPDFVTKADFDWAVSTAMDKQQQKLQKAQHKGTAPDFPIQDFSRIGFFEYDEGECVQCMHLGSYDDEPATIQQMQNYAAEQGYTLDIQNPRYHHEIYLSDPRRCAPEKLKTVIRHPIKKA